MEDVVNLEDCGIRLSVYQKTRLDIIKESIPKPVGYLPPQSLPGWELIPIDRKLPMVPAPPGAIYYTRGPLAKTLARKHDIYSTRDPLNRERIPSDKYEPLHDPQNQLDTNFLATQYLINNGIVNQNGEVVCSLKEFNRYRKYLASLYSDKVRQKVTELDNLQAFERDMNRAYIRHENEESATGSQMVRKARLVKVQQFLAEKEDLKKRRFQMKAQLEDQRRANLAIERKRMQVEKVKLGEEKKALQLKMLVEKNKIEIAKQKEYLHKMTLHDLTATAHREHIKNEKKIIREQKLSDWFDAKILSAAERLQREKEIQAEYVDSIKRRAIRRQKFIERFRAELPIRMARAAAEKQRLEDIVRKYAMRWLNRVRERLRKPRDELHESLWYSEKMNALTDSVKYLYEVSGHEKLDDVVMNILKFKEALKKQMLREDDDDDDEWEEDEEGVAEE